MNIICLHGYYIFSESKGGEIAEFNNYYNQDLKAKDTYYTFEDLAYMPSYSVKGNKILEANAIKTYEGRPWDILRANKLIYDFRTKMLVNIDSLGSFFKPSPLRGFNISTQLVVCGSYGEDGKKITGYNCSFSFTGLIFKYTEFFYD